MHALNQTWHLKCFSCSICGIPFNDGIFHFVNEKPYCANGKSNIMYRQFRQNIFSHKHFFSIVFLFAKFFFSLNCFINSFFPDAPGGPAESSIDNADTCSLDETCSLFTTDSYNDAYDRPISMMSYQSSICGQPNAINVNTGAAEHPRLAHLKNRWARINQISKDYDKHTVSNKYVNPLLR